MRVVVASLAILLLTAAAATAMANEGQTSSTAANTCSYPSGGNLYKRASCAKDCYASFCGCLQTSWYTNNTAIVDSIEPGHMGGLGCLSNYWGSCDQLQSCTAELVECTKSKTSSTCNTMLGLAVLGVAAGSDSAYNTSSTLQQSCEYTTCDIFNRTRNYYYGQRCTLTQAQVNSTCINPAFFRGTLRLTADVYRLQWDSSYSASLRAAVLSDLKALFIGMNVWLQSVSGQKTLTVDFAVDRRSSDSNLKGAMTFGQASKYWLYSTSAFIRGTSNSLPWDYFGPRITRMHSFQCFSNARSIPYVAVSGTSLRIDVIGKNESDCLTGSLAASRTLKVVASLESHIDINQYEWSYRHLLSDARNADAGTVTFDINSTDGTGVATVHCGASDTLFDISLQTSTMSYHYGKVQCVKAYPGKTAYPPANITAWVSTKSASTAGRLLLAAWANAGSATNLAVTTGVLGALPTEYFGTDFAAFQSAVNMYADGTDGLFVADACAAVQNKTFAFATRSSLVLLGGNYYGTACTGTATMEAFAGVQGIVANADVILTDASVDPAIVSRAEVRSVTMGFPAGNAVADRKILERYALYRMERQSAVCTQTTATSSPDQISGNIGFEGTVYFNGVCDVVACGFDGVWSSAVASNGRSCTLPMLTSWSWGQLFPVQLKKADGTIVSTNTKVSYSWYDYMYVSDWRATQDNQVTIYTASNEPVCYQLRCLNGVNPIPNIEAMPVYGAKHCVTSFSSYDWGNYWVYHWYTVYGWKRYFYGWSDVTFARPNSSAVPVNCRSLALEATSGSHQIFSLNLPLDASQPRGSTEGALGGNRLLAVTRLSPVGPAVPVAARNGWCRKWAQEDRADLTSVPRLEEATNCFQCPARIIETMPWGLWRMWWWGRNWWWWPVSQIGNANTEACYEANGQWGVGGTQPWVRRCCYDISTQFIGAPLIPHFPSTLQISSGWAWPNWFQEQIVQAIAETVPEKVCCTNGNAQTCAPFRDRRAVGQGTTAPYSINTAARCTRTWTPAPPAGWGRGDPYCTSYDGAGFECNFWGEALWTGCNKWKVHVTAVPVGTNNMATVINGVAIDEGNDTVVILRNPVTGKANVTLNDAFIEQNTDGSVLFVTFDQNDMNNTLIRVRSISGHVVEVEAKANFFVVATTPNRTCIGKCTGLLGNCDGDKTNDLKNYWGNVSLAINASSETIYHEIVKSYVVNTSMSLFPGVVSVPPAVNASSNATAFVPSFVTPAVLAACPAVCKGEAGCCLDASVGGAAFANETAATVNTIAVAANQTVPLVGYNWPPELHYPSRVVVLRGLAVTMVLNASDSDGLRSFGINLCTTSSAVTCVTMPAPLNHSSIKLQYTATANISGVITAVDNKGKTTIGYFDIIALEPTAAPTISVTVSFSIVGRGAWTASTVYSLRAAIMSDLSNIVNTYYTTGAGKAAAFQPATTTASDFGLTSVNDQATTDGTVQVGVTSYVTGTTQQEAQARAAALSASTIALPTFEAQLKTLVPGASLGTSTAVQGTQAPMGTSTPSTNSTGGGNSDSGSASTTSGVSPMSFLASIVAALVAVLLL